MPLADNLDENFTLAIDLPTPEATSQLGETLAALLGTGDIIALYGPLGAGKTALARALIQALGVEDEVPSPTFTLVQTYPVVGRDFEAIWHFDLYRIEGADEAWELGIEDAFDGGVSLIEWPERLGDELPEGALHIRISTKDNGRESVLVGGTSWQVRLATLKEQMA